MERDDRAANENIIGRHSIFENIDSTKSFPGRGTERTCFSLLPVRDIISFRKLNG